jgi:hypothetical protein
LAVAFMLNLRYRETRGDAGSNQQQIIHTIDAGLRPKNAPGLPVCGGYAGSRREQRDLMAARSGVVFGYASDPETGDPLYAYKPSLMGAPWQFRLAADALEWRVGTRSDRVPYGRMRRLRLSFRPAAMQGRRFVAEIWPMGGPKLTVASSSWKGIAEREPLDAGYLTFVTELHRRMAAAGTRAAFVRGAPPLLYWPVLAATVAAALAMVGLTVEALRSGVIAGALFVAAFLAVFVWQMGGFCRHNRPGTYRPDVLPAGVLPASGLPG